MLIPAANRALDEARKLLDAKEYHGAVYLGGYSSEMILGYAYGRFTGLPTSRPAFHAVVQPARTRAIALLGEAFVTAHFRQGHSPYFWWSLHKEERIRAGRAFPQMVLEHVDPAIDFLHQSWLVAIRYLPRLVSQQEAQDVLAACNLILNLGKKLWR